MGRGEKTMRKESKGKEEYRKKVKNLHVKREKKPEESWKQEK